MSIIPLYGYLQVPVDGHLGDLQFLAIMNKVSLNILVHFFGHMFLLSFE